MDQEILKRVESSQNESADLDFKAGFDPHAPHDWCELIKDVVAMANSGGGLLVFGVDDDGMPSITDLTALASVDPAHIVDKIAKYTDQHVTAVSVSTAERCGRPVIVVAVSGVSVPVVFASPGTYDIGGGKQRTCFGRGTVYFRHGAKSEPGTTEDLRLALERALDRVRSSWLDGITKLVTAPAGATISVLPAEVHLTGAEGGVAIRLVNDETAPAFNAVRTDLLYPHRQKELVARVNELLGGHIVSGHDVHCVRKVHAIDAQPMFFYKPQYSSPQYSEAFAEWLVAEYHRDPQFFYAARESLKAHESARPTATA